MRSRMPMLGLLIACVSIAMTSCSQEGKLRSKFVADCTSQGAPKPVCTCAFGKLKYKYGLDALIVMSEGTSAPPDFIETMVAAALECKTGKTDAVSSALVGVGDAAESASSVGEQVAAATSHGEEPPMSDSNSARTASADDPRKPVRAVLFGDVLPNDADGLPVISVSDFGAAGTGYSDAVLEVAKQIRDSNVRWQFCERESKALRNWPDWEEVLDACKTGTAPKSAPATSSQDDFKECLIQGSCGDSWGRQHAALESVLDEKQDWSTGDVLQISSEAVRRSFPDAENGPRPEAVEFRQKFCGMYRQQLEADEVMDLCLLGVYGD